MPKLINDIEVPDQPQYGPGKVVIYGGRRQKLVGEELRNHPTYVGELGGYYLFASHDTEEVPSFSVPPVAELTVGEADYICSQLLGTCFVVLNQGGMKRPKTSIIVKLSDWKKIQLYIEGNGDYAQGRQASAGQYFRALVTGVGAAPTFRAICMHPETARKMSVARFNVGSWMKSTWGVSAGHIKKDTLEICILKQEQRDCSKIVPDAGCRAETRQLLLICHMNEFWRRNEMSKKDMAASLAALLPNDGHLNEDGMSEALINAAFRNPPESDLPGLFKKLQNEAIRGCAPVEPRTSFLNPQRLCWLLSAALPLEFSGGLKEGKSVLDLTNCKNAKRKYKFPV